MVDATGKSVVVDRSSTTLKPCQQTRPGICRDLELNRTTGLLLNDPCSGSNFRSCDKFSDFHFYGIAAAQLAVDCEIKQRAISHASFPIKEKTDRPNLALFQRLFDTNHSNGVPSRATECFGILLCNTHFCSPSANIGRQKNI
jgi:hypothetical protein